MKIKLTLTEEMLGTASADPNIHKEYIASKSPNPSTIEDEVAAIGADAVIEKSMTVFPRDGEMPFIYDYQIKGFFKDACSSLARVPGTKSSKLKAYKKIIDGTIFVFPRKIQIDAAGPIGTCQRPLRAQTAQGERVALANSETIPSGSTITFEVKCLDESQEAVVREWFAYGAMRGLGQWRNSGKGRFTAEIS